MNEAKQYRWRVCPLGRHLVREHIRHTEYKAVPVRNYCRMNKSRKEILTSLEIQEIYDRNKDKVKVFPNQTENTAENKFDILIGMWTQFWNEVLGEAEPLDPNLLKALIYSESNFKEDSLNKSNPKNPAKGLMQITKSTQKILTNSRGELKEVCFYTDEKDNFDPNVSIAMGSRWLFRKKEILKSKLNREPSWEEVVWEYKGIYKDDSLRAKNIKTKLRDYYEKLTKNN